MKQKKEKELTEKELLRRIKALGKIDNEKRNAVICALIGHSKIQTHCFSYYNCGRCDAQVGDSLAGVYSAKDVVIVGHDCETCRKNFELCTWKDKLYAKDPFPHRRPV